MCCGEDQLGPAVPFRGVSPQLVALTPRVNRRECKAPPAVCNVGSDRPKAKRPGVIPAACVSGRTTTSPTSGDSSIAQTFTAPTGSPSLSFWWRGSCPDTVQYDWATATLTDNTTGATTTPLPKTCATTTWKQVTTTLTGGHTYTLTLTSHDENSPGDATYTRYDDVTVG